MDGTQPNPPLSRMHPFESAFSCFARGLTTIFEDDESVLESGVNEPFVQEEGFSKIKETTLTANRDVGVSTKEDMMDVEEIEELLMNMDIERSACNNKRALEDSQSQEKSSKKPKMSVMLNHHHQ